MKQFKLFLTLLLLFVSAIAFSQKKIAYVSGKVLDENENPLPNVSVVILGAIKRNCYQ